MLKEALRRLFWLGPTLLAVTIPTFWALARTTDAHAGAHSRLPLFFNPEPRGAREQALDAMARVVAGGADAEAGESRLQALGGAALPHVLPRLDALGPDSRGRVARALTKVAERMGVLSAGEIDSNDAAVSFFGQYWAEHAVDFRPAAVRRAVRRFADHPSALRRAEVLELDTFALEELLGAMRPIDTPRDVDRVRMVCSAAAHVTGSAWTVPESATPLDARRVVSRWDAFWTSHRTDFVALTGTARLSAPLRETRYGQWLERVALRRLGAAEGETDVVAELRARGPVTLWLVLAALLLGYPAGLALSLVSRAVGRPSLDVAVWLCAAVLASLGIVGTATLVDLLSDSGERRLPAFACVTLVALSTAFRHQRVMLEATMQMPHVRTARAFGASRSRVLARNLKLTVGVAVARGASDLPLLLTAAFVAERAFSLHGLSDATVTAVRRGDHAFLMAFALLGTLTLGVAQIGADVVLRALDPRISGAPERGPGASR